MRLPDFTVMDWKCIKRAKGCLSCGRAFSDGEKFYSILFREKDEFPREDYCIACWERLDSGKRESSLSCWQGYYKAEPPKSKEEAIAKSVVERLLRKYLDSDDPSHVNVRYILALVMERRKKLIPRDRVVDPETGKKIIIYELAGDGETFLIEDPGLELKHTKEVQRQVRELLEREGVKSKGSGK